MPHNDRVIWSEGMFLRPQHYQQYTRYIENRIEERSACLGAFPWGFSDIQLDQKLLGLGKVSITSGNGVFQDGTPFRMPEDDELPLALTVPENIKNEIIYLCIPLYRSGTGDVDYQSDPDSLARYAPRELDVYDDVTLGGQSATIQLGKLRCRLMVQSQHRDEYACLGIVRVVEVKADNSLVIDNSYIPPALDCQNVARLSGFLQELQGLLKHRAEALVGRVIASGRGGAAEIADFLMLQVVNRYIPLLAHLSTLGRFHPESLYRLLISLSGEMATFTASDKRAPIFEPYRHDQLFESFEPVFEALRQSLSMVLEQTAVPLPLKERQYGIRVSAIGDKSLLDDASFVLAVAADIPTEELRQRFAAQVKIGPVEQIRQLVNVQLPGIRIRPMPVAPRQIPFHTGFVYFELESSGDLWQQLKSSGGFAFHVSGEFPGLKIEFWAIRGQPLS